MIKAVIDRFEADKAVVLFGDSEAKGVLPKKCLPDSAKEGDYLKIEIICDEAMTKAAKQEAKALLNKVTNKINGA